MCGTNQQLYPQFLDYFSVVCCLKVINLCVKNIPDFPVKNADFSSPAVHVISRIWVRVFSNTHRSKRVNLVETIPTAQKSRQTESGRERYGSPKFRGEPPPAAGSSPEFSPAD